MRFSVALRRRDTGLVRAQSPGKPDLSVAVPPEFHGRHEGIWSPEELLATSAAACWAVTFESVASHRDVPVRDLDVRAATVVERVDGRYQVALVDVTATIETEPGRVDDARRAAERAERLCLISGALAVPVRLRVDVGVSPGLLPAASG